MDWEMPSSPMRGYALCPKSSSGEKKKEEGKMKESERERKKEKEKVNEKRNLMGT